MHVCVTSISLSRADVHKAMTINNVRKKGGMRRATGLSKPKTMDTVVYLDGKNLLLLRFQRPVVRVDCFRLQEYCYRDLLSSLSSHYHVTSTSFDFQTSSLLAFFTLIGTVFNLQTFSRFPTCLLWGGGLFRNETF